MELKKKRMYNYNEICRKYQTLHGQIYIFFISLLKSQASQYLAYSSIQKPSIVLWGIKMQTSISIVRYIYYIFNRYKNIKMQSWISIVRYYSFISYKNANLKTH